jgi:hypothetical protein
MDFFAQFSNPFFLKVFSLLSHILAYAFPFILVIMGWHFWVRHRNAEWLASLKWVLLEIKIPKDIYKSPQAMEVALGNALFQTGGVGTNYAKYWQGKLLVWFSLEIISSEGEIRFFIRTPVQFKNYIESQIYAQYPQAEILEVPDYTLPILHSMTQEEWGMWGCEHTLKKADAFPIKTYADYGLDKPISKPEDAAGLIDPITPAIEWMGTMKKDEHVWMQILVRATKDSYYNPTSMIPKKEDWKDKAKREMEKIKAKYDGADALDKLGKALKITKAEQEAIGAIERSLDKPAFDVGIRTIYLAKKPAYTGSHVFGILGLMKSYNSNNLNGFKPSHTTDFDNPWEDISGERKILKKRHMLHAYVDRGYFYPPHKGHYFVLTAEELATIYHFPGRVSTTPTFKRIESKKSEPPVNLPL